MLARLSRAAALAGLLCLPLPAGVADAQSADDGQALDVRRLSAGAAPPAPGRRHHRLPGGRDHRDRAGRGRGDVPARPARPRGRGAHEPGPRREGSEHHRLGAAGPGRDGGRARGLQALDRRGRGGAGRLRRGRRRPPQSLGGRDRGLPRGPGHAARHRPGGGGGGRRRPVAGAAPPARAGVPGARARRRGALRAPRRRHRPGRGAAGGRGGRADRRPPDAAPGRRAPALSRPSRAPPRSASSTG